MWSFAGTALRQTYIRLNLTSKQHLPILKAKESYGRGNVLSSVLNPRSKLE